MTKSNIRLIIYASLVLILMVASYFIGRKNPNIDGDYRYIKSERLDSLEKASSDKELKIDSISSALELLRIEIDGTLITTDGDVRNVIEYERDELYNKKPSRIDTLFIIGYDSAVGARRLQYN